MFFVSVYSIDFNILSEGGNYDHWKYSARYEEFLLYFPYVRYFIDGHFNVKPAGGGTYIIQSTHNTCFLYGLFCCMYAGIIHVACHAVGVNVHLFISKTMLTKQISVKSDMEGLYLSGKDSSWFLLFRYNASFT
jgi:hypothetical protein